MARALRVQFEGAIYHVSSRGNERGQIYRTDADRDWFLERLFEYVQTHHIRLYAYVLMSNHYHLLFETPRANLSAFMQQLNSAYAIYFNLTHRRKGHLFGGRYKAKLVEGDEYLLKLTRYVHLNPVKIRAMAGYDLPEKRKRLRSYRWSSYRSYAGLAKRQDTVDYGPLTELVAMKLLNEEGGLTQREVAAQLGFQDGSTVSRRVAGLVQRLKIDRILRRKHARIHERIRKNTEYKA